MSSLRFDAYLEYASTPKNAVLDTLFASPFSVDFWYKPSRNGSTAGDAAYLLQYGSWNPGFTFVAQALADGSMQFNIAGTPYNGAVSNITAPASAFTLHQWHHIVICSTCICSIV